MITIYGASDDLIEIEGDLREEFNTYLEDNRGRCGILACSDGTLLSVTYNGFWRFHILNQGTASLHKTEGTNEENDYSDHVTLDGEIKWVVYGEQHVK